MNRCYKCKYFTTVKPFYVDPHEYCYMGYLSAFGKPELCPIQPMPTEAGTDPDEYERRRKEKDATAKQVNA